MAGSPITGPKESKALVLTFPEICASPLTLFLGGKGDPIVFSQRHRIMKVFSAIKNNWFVGVHIIGEVAGCRDIYQSRIYGVGTANKVHRGLYVSKYVHVHVQIQVCTCMH